MKAAKVVQLTSVQEPFHLRVFYKECKSLARAGYEVTLVVPHSKDEIVDGVRIKAVPQPIGRLSRMTLTVWRVYREAVRQAADVYNFYDPELMPVGLLLRARRKKVVYDILEDHPRTFCDKTYLPGWLRCPLAWLTEHIENLACRWFSALVLSTPAIAERFYAVNRNTVVIQNYPILEEFLPRAEVAWSERAYSVAYVGGICDVRGAREMVKAMDLLPDTLHATLRLAGPFQPENFRDELARLPGWKRVDELGVLDRDGVAELLGSVRAGLVIPQPGPNFVRSKPVKLYEYMCSGIPVIASDFPFWREIIQSAGCGLLVDPLNPEAIAQAIEYTLTHPEEAEAMGRRGREAVEKHYNWGNEERKLLQLYADQTHHYTTG